MILDSGGADVLWAHHSLVLALPAFVPAVVVVAVVLRIALKDRREERQQREDLP